MSSRLIIDGNSVYEIDEDCEKSRFGNQRGQQGTRMGNGPRTMRQENTGTEKSRKR